MLFYIMRMRERVMVCRSCNNNMYGDLPICPFCGKTYRYWLAGNKAAGIAKADKSTVDVVVHIAAIIGGLICILGLFLPFIKATYYRRTETASFIKLIANDGTILFVVGLAGMLGSIFRKYIVSVINGIIYGVVFILNADNVVKQFGIGYYKLYFKAFGWHLMILGFIVLITSGIVGIILKYKNRYCRLIK